MSKCVWSKFQETQASEKPSRGGVHCGGGGGVGGSLGLWPGQKWGERKGAGPHRFLPGQATRVGSPSSPRRTKVVFFFFFFFEKAIS